MGKVFEDYYTEIQTDMISICLEYVESRAEKIYIYCSCEGDVISGNFFYMINKKVVQKNRLNDALISGQKEYDVSIKRQSGVLDIIFDDIKALMKLCQDYGKDMPTQIKLIYDVSENKMHAEYEYDEVYSNDPNKTAYDVLEEWYEFEKNNN